MSGYRLPHLRELETEAIFVIREAAAEFAAPVLLFSGGKDSTVLLHLAQKAFWPSPLPMPLLHIDTGHNFAETIAFRDQLTRELNLRMIVEPVQALIDQGLIIEEQGPRASRNHLQTACLLKAIRTHGFDAAIGGARRDEEKARAKERFFSFRDEFGQWDPKRQRPELWQLFNCRHRQGEHFRVFPLSNWTELDVWQYIAAKQLPLPAIYFSHPRQCFTRDGVIMACSPHLRLQEGETAEEMQIRFRTVGDMTCTGAMRSAATTVEEIIIEITQLHLSERGSRADDQRSDFSMEERKRTGYF